MMYSYNFLLQETLVTYPFTEVISTRRFRADNNTNFLDMKCGNLMVQKITRVETDQVCKNRWNKISLYIITKSI